MLLTVDHVTLYRYSQPVRGVVQSHRLTPSKFDGQRVLNWEVIVSDGIRGGSFVDGAGDHIQAWTVQGPVSEITVTVRGKVETTDLVGVLRGHKEKVPPQCYLGATAATTADMALAELADSVDADDNGLALAHGLSALVSDTITYRTGTTHAMTTAAEALAQGKGVCQDQTHALLVLARRNNIPARYVSGYLHSTQDGAAHEAAHAWAELWLEGLGWVGFDPANRCSPDERYIRLGSGLDAMDAAPIKGTARGQGAESLDVKLEVQQSEQ
ncbi:transglutaminase family protein [Pseudorhodobacter wandonensis]|uniref:transglutaminase family protein n=1 Tax=Pseudorhodobacter wandonensis TaxID=1120568 RepID=UPI00067CCF9B|nr:transglutaminase family protein [Pseudorhodobacter wandonensis]